MNLLQRLQEKDPERDVVFTAVETLRAPSAIREFRDQYASYLHQHGDIDAGENPREVAGTCIVRTALYYGRKTAEQWQSALE